MLSLILSGGTGTRFWPLSRADRPKQVLSLLADEPLIKETIKRIGSLTPPRNIFVVTTKETLNAVIPHLSDIPEENIIVEPSGKNTAPCILLSLRKILKRFPSTIDDVVVIMPSDHYIGKAEKFLKYLSSAAIIARENDYIVTLGIIPHSPETGYGYINTKREEVASALDIKAFKVTKFIEKPDRTLAQRFIREEGYYWNSGIFIGRVSIFLEEYQNYLPTLSEKISKMIDVEDGKEEGNVDSIYEEVKPISIDYGIMEYSKRVALIPCEMEWHDLGSWKCLEEIGRSYYIKGEPLQIDSSGLIIYAPDKFAVALGVKDLLLVDTGDVLLIADKGRVQEIKGIVEELKNRGLKEYI